MTVQTEAAPDTETAIDIASAMLREPVHQVRRIPVGAQNFVYAVAAKSGDYVLRLTHPKWVDSFRSAVAIQDLLLPFGVPIVPFLAHDLSGNFSPFPAHLMRKVEGQDLINAYPFLSHQDKVALADRAAEVHASMKHIEWLSGFGVTEFGQATGFKSWSAFMQSRITWCIDELERKNVLPRQDLEKAGLLIMSALDHVDERQPQLFIWDMGDRNLMVQGGAVTGIVDVDRLAYGDPLYTVALAGAALDKDCMDDVYVQRWLQHYPVDARTLRTFKAYKLFWTMNFLRGTGTVRSNGNAESDRKEYLLKLLKTSLDADGI